MQPADIKSVGIIGAGRIGQAMAQIARRAGRPVVIANRHGPQSLASLVQGLGGGVSAGTVNEAAGADIVVLAVMWPDVPLAVEGLEWEGRILIDPTNDFDPSDLNGRTSSEVVADLVAPARVVKAANIFAAELLASDPHQAGGQRVMFLSGDNADAQIRGGRVVRSCGIFCHRPWGTTRGRTDASVRRSARRPQPDPSRLRSISGRRLARSRTRRPAGVELPVA